MDRIARDPTTVVCPIIDTIADDSFEYRANGYQVGGFAWNLQVWNLLCNNFRAKFQLANMSCIVHLYF